MPRVCITVKGKNAQPYRFSLDREVVRLGRAADNDIVIDCPSVSSHHCEMKRIKGGFILEDDDSTNGIKLEGDRMAIIDLANGLDLKVGDATLEFELTGEEKDALSEEEHKPRQRVHLPKKEEKKKAQKEKKEKKDKLPASKSPRPAPRGPMRPGSPGAASPLATAQTTSGANFAITIGLLFVALMAFYFGLASGHRSKFPSTDYPTSKGLWGDMWSDTPLRKKVDPSADPEPGDGE